MDWATSRRLFYIIIFFAILVMAGIFFAIPYFNKPPTCFDGKQNGLENGIDCGGACEFVCKFEANEVQVDWQRALPSRNGQVVLVAYLDNHNKTLGIKNAPYRFRIYDSNGSTIASKEGETYVPANSQMAFFDGPVDIGTREVSKVTFEFTEPLNYSRVSTSTALIAAQVVDTDFTNEGGPKLTIKIRNNEKKQFDSVPVVVVLYNKDGNAVLSSRSVVDILPPEGDAELYFAWPITLDEQITDIDVLPLFNQFEIDKQNTKNR